MKLRIQCSLCPNNSAAEVYSTKSEDDAGCDNSRVICLPGDWKPVITDDSDGDGHYKVQFICDDHQVPE